MKEYLSIGELAKLMGVTIKALRYYEKLGILKPAYVNEETGYRYYLPEQIMVLDFILLCLELKLPLKQFSNFDPDGESMNVEKILLSAQQKANEELARIQRTIHKLDNISRHLEVVDDLMAESNAIRKLDEKYLLLMAIDKNCSVEQYTKTLTKLYEIIESQSLVTRYEQGILIYPNQEGASFWLFVTVEPPDEEPNCMTLTIPAGEGICEYHPEQDTLSSFKQFLQQWERYLDTPVMFVARYQRHISGNIMDTQVVRYLEKRI